MREWQKGDSPKWIHWRTTARLSQPAVRQFEQQRRFDMCILVDAYAESTEYDDNVELAISLAGTFLIHLIASPSNRVVLAVAGTKADAVIGGGSIEGKRRMLELLADVTPTSQPTVDEAVKKALHIVGATQDLIVISPRSLDAVKESDPSIATTISMWVRRGSFRWIDVSDSDIDCWIRRDTVALAKALRDDKQKVTTSELTEVV